MNFKAKFLRMVFFYSEYLYVSMVEPAPESLARYPLYFSSILEFDLTRISFSFYYELIWVVYSKTYVYLSSSD